jgi:hypothetical protein
VRPPPERHRRLREVFDAALRREPSDRPAYVDATCIDDPELRSHVVRLLAAHDEQNSFLEHRTDVYPAARPAIRAFTGTDRFHVIRQLGAGGMGVVYEVHDRLRDEVVALKTLRRTGAADLYRLKREFRGLADVTHHNLACLYELFVDDEQSFFTMELVRGVPFVDYVREPDGGRVSIDRLVPALRQLVDGVSALHRQGKLHRDIKPSNVLVTPGGRVVLLDFGLIADTIPPHAGEEWAGGTPAYMSPEEAAGGAPSEASDWYAVGVTMYEALSGSLPFTGPMPDVLRQKRDADPPAPADVTPHDASPALIVICMGLLRRDPVERLTGPAAVHLLGGDATIAPTPHAPAHDVPFVGRQAQLDSLDDSRAAVGNGAARSVAIQGPSGIGKSALVRRFLRDLPPGRTVVLTGRCYENESVPYKALDGVIDELSRYLRSVSPGRVDALLPANVTALARVFPVLLQVETIAARVRGAPQEMDADPLRVRQRAIEALQAVFATLSRSCLLVIWIDDLQWSDADSIVLLEELLAAPPAMLTLMCFRQEEVGSKAFLQDLLDRDGRSGWSTLTLEPMNDDEARAFVGSVLSGTSQLTDDARRRMTSEAAGSPFVLEQLALSAGSASERSGVPTFAGVFESRLNALQPDARLFLETLALCGRPVAPALLFDACGVGRDRQSLVARLRSSRFIRSSGSSDHVETYHDRIREVIAGRIAPGEAREIHRRMAASMIARESDDCESLFVHYRGSGDTERASVQAGLAAEKASAALAFDRAASFYSHAIELAPSAAAAPGWREELARALANAARPAEAAEAYLSAAAGVSHTRQVELRRCAAEQFLTGGHIDRGLELMRQLLADVGLRGVSSPRAAVPWVMWRRARLRWRGLRFHTRPVAAVDRDLLLRLDTSWAVGAGLALVDVLSASNFVAQHLHLALDAGEPSRIVRGAALEWAARNSDWHFRPGSEPLRRLATALADEVGTPEATAMVALAESMTAICCGQWKRAFGFSERALTILREQCVGVPWEMNMAQNLFIWALMYQGELGELSRRVPAVLEDARRRGNLYLATEVTTRSNFVWLAADDPEGGEREAIDAMSRWSEKGFHRQHYSFLLARVQTALYRGESATAWRLLEEQKANMRRSMLTRVQVLRVEALYLRARCAIAVAAADPANRRFLATARRCARRIARERMPWSDPFAWLIRAGIASVEGQRHEAAAYLDEAANGFERGDMNMYLAVTRRRIGTLRRDVRGREVQRQAETWMAAQQIKNPVFLTRMYAPGFADEPVGLN